jgi:hypothetical protein
MIKLNNRMLIEFGSGDILVGGMLCADGVGVLTLNDTSERHEIGESVYCNEAIDPFDVPIVMSFSDIRSVDVLIDHLNSIRIGMKDYEDGKFDVEGAE